MNVHIYARGGDFKVKDEHGMTTMKQHVTIGLANRMSDELVTHYPIVDKEILLIGLTARVRG